MALHQSLCNSLSKQESNKLEMSDLEELEFIRNQISPTEEFHDFGELVREFKERNDGFPKNYGRYRTLSGEEFVVEEDDDDDSYSGYSSEESLFDEYESKLVDSPNEPFTCHARKVSSGESGKHLPSFDLEDDASVIGFPFKEEAWENPDAWSTSNWFEGELERRFCLDLRNVSSSWFELPKLGVEVPLSKRRKTSSSREELKDKIDERPLGRMIVQALPTPKFCPWRNKKGSVKKGRRPATN